MKPPAPSPKIYRDRFILRIKAARESSGMSQAQMAQLLGMPQDHYKTYENRSLMPHRLIAPFCQITGHHPWYILTGKPGTESPGGLPE